ncbi:sensor histidine kinase [Vibrio sp. RC586]|uniref:sensor histidine kinase n=1 Tax=Vibrio sp. RC586 TaxID=675815 RepID=UPI0001BB7DAC|nr:ATP-binding protein [Vibrio sp. RC586]EEZ00474.1 sensor histidine kinase [Vibrio sp. RC586]
MSIRLKTMLGVALIEAFLLTILITFTLSYLESTNYDGLKKRAHTTIALFSTMVKNAVLAYDLASLESAATLMMSNQDIVYVCVENAHGKELIFKGERELFKAYHTINDEDFSQLQPIYTASDIIEVSGTAFGTVFIGFDLSYLEKQLEHARRWTLLIILGEMGLVALFSYMLGNALTRRLTQLKIATDQITFGNREVLVDIKGHDEISRVAHSFQQMIQSLRHSEATMRDYQHQLEQWNLELEDKVNQRTETLLAKNQQLEEMNTKLTLMKDKLVETEKMVSIGTLAAGFAHEINNPNGALKSHLQLIQQDFNQIKICFDNIELMLAGTSYHDKFFRIKNDLYIEESVSGIEESLRDALHCVDRIKTIVDKVQRCQTQPNRHNSSWVSPLSLLEQAITICGLREWVVWKEQALYPPLIYCYSNDFITAFSAILNNAFQAYTINDPNVRIELSLRHEQHQLEIEIVDFGRGMSPEEKQHAFDPFFTTHDVGKGVGLGLTEAYSSIKKYAGDIQLFSEQGQGTRVFITLPLAPSQP